MLADVPEREELDMSQDYAAMAETETARWKAEQREKAVEKKKREQQEHEAFVAGIYEVIAKAKNKAGTSEHAHQ